LTNNSVVVYTANTMKNITLSAPEELIEKARQRAANKGTTLNNEFREWLKAQTISGEDRVANYEQLMKKLSYVNAGRKFTREEMNER
jgi:plasmid stability protein